MLANPRNTFENIKIIIIKDLCEKVLNEKFLRSNFPANKDFLGPNKFTDIFQEAALFCTVPITAEQYVTKGMSREVIEKIPEEWHNDYCHVQNGNLEYYKKIKTTDNMRGKGFWCAVRMLYQKKETEPERDHEHGL